jgi:hypothetical protein
MKRTAARLTVVVLVAIGGVIGGALSAFAEPEGPNDWSLADVDSGSGSDRDLVADPGDREN